MKKLDTSQLKGFLDKLSIIRNYSAFIMPTVLTVVALLLLFIPAPLMSGRLKERMKKSSVAGGKQIKSFSNQKISREQWKIERDYQDVYSQDANEMSRMIKQSSQRPLLSYVIFPEPNEKSAQIFENFGRTYRSSIESMIKNLHGRECPTDVEISNSLQKSESGSNTSERRDRYSRTGRRSTERLSFNNEVEKTIVDELCTAAAKSASFYVNAADLAGYEYWDTGVGVDTDTADKASSRYKYQSIEQSVEVCWYWQLGYWIVEDILSTAGAMNSNCESALDCPVKRLISVDFGKGSSTGRGGDSGEDAMPFYILEADGGLARTFTKRISDDKIDVIHFKLSVLVRADDALSFMHELCSAREHTFNGWAGNEAQQKFKHNQITILDASIDPIEIDDAEHELYRYGNDAVVQVDMTCEYIFDTAGYNTIKPGFIKDIGEEEDS